MSAGASSDRMAVGVPRTGMAEALRTSRWIGEVRGLGPEIARLELAMGAERTDPGSTGGPRGMAALVPAGSVGRLGRLAGDATATQLRWGLRQLNPATSDPLGAVANPGRWRAERAADFLRDQLAGLGPTAADLARAVDEAEPVIPPVLVRALRERPVEIRPMDARTVRSIVRRRLGKRADGVGVGAVDPQALLVDAFGQVHRGRLSDGTPVLVRVLRPGVRRAVVEDLRLLRLALPAARIVTSGLRARFLGDALEATRRSVLQRTDLRHEVLNSVELGIAIERLGITGVQVARPVVGFVDESVAVYEDSPAAVPLIDSGLPTRRVDVAAVVTALFGVTLRAALAEGLFAVGSRPDRLLIEADGSVLLVGCAALGRFEPTQRRAAATAVVAAGSGDADALAEALAVLGVVPSHVDPRRLAATLAGSAPLQPARLLPGSAAARAQAAKELAGLVRRYELRMPPEVVLLAQSMLGARHVARGIGGSSSMLGAVLPMLPTLQALAAPDPLRQESRS